MTLQQDLREALTHELAGLKADALTRRAATLQGAYRSGEVPTGVILESAQAVAAYAAYRMPATFAAVRLALEQLASAVPTLAPHSLLDVGAGTGAATWAALDVLETLDAVMLLEQSAPARTVGASLAARAGLGGLTWQDWRLSASSGALPQADLAVCSYVIGELPEALQDHLVDLLADAAPTVVLIEPGTPAGYRRVIRARERLLARGLAVAAPCPHEQPCPLVDDWCHLPVRVERSPLHRAIKGGSLSSEDEKFSYVASTRLPVEAQGSRVIRKPLVRKGFVELPVCTPEGEARTATVSKRHGEAYKRARKADWGDAVVLP